MDTMTSVFFSSIVSLIKTKSSAYSNLLDAPSFACSETTSTRAAEREGDD